jgi:hypothetical protein
MGIIAAGLAIVAAAATVLLLIAFRAGTRRQEHAGSLARRAPGPAAGLTRRVTGLYAEPLRQVAPQPASQRQASTGPKGRWES